MYFQLYLKHIDLRYNHRNENTFEILADILVKEVSKVKSDSQAVRPIAKTAHLNYQKASRLTKIRSRSLCIANFYTTLNSKKM